MVAAVDGQPRHRPPRKRAGRLRGACGARRRTGAGQPRAGAAARHLPTEQAKLEAALPKFLEAADRYPATQAGIAASYHAAGILATLGRFSEAEQRYQEVVSKAGSSLYGRTGRLGLAQAQVAQKKYDSAITLYTELSRDTNSQMPVDGVLMQLGRACALAGRKEEAVRAFTRVTEEFPASIYFADAKRELEDARKS